MQQYACSLDPFWAVRTLEFATALESVHTADAALELFRREIAEVGFHAYLITALDEREFSRRILARCWHSEWETIYADKNLNGFDPVRVKLVQRPTKPFLWSEAAREAGDDIRARFVMNRAAEFRMNEGVCVPVYRDGRAVASISISGEKPDFGPGVRPALHIMSLLAFNRFSAFFSSKSVRSGTDKRLTDREREVLRWVLVGKSDRDIGEILKISTRTALAHVVNAAQKLNAANRTSAVVEALRVGEISISH
jgi:LuxR family quorum sensing-dependent transcriptional regulator